MASRLKPGDTVRYLNAVGGGRVVRVDGDIAYVDDDGFETPVAVRECVVVGQGMADAVKSQPVPSKDSTPAPQKSKPAVAAVETPGGNKLTLLLAFEPVNIKALSQSDFDAFFVNDSNYSVYIAVAIRASDDKQWSLRYDGMIEPNMQEYLFTLGQSELSRFDRLAVQYVAFKRGRQFDTKSPGDMEFKVDATKFAKLHCFRHNPYFNSPVIAFEIVESDRVALMPELDAAAIAAGMKQKERDTAATAPRRTSTPADRHNDVIEVDLHASALFESTEGLTPADILNYQVERFARTMDANLRRIGQKIVFIHGKGEGVLRQALMKELTHRYKGHDVQDASFREYGFGATQVTIRRVSPDSNNAPANQSKDKKRRR